MQDRIKDAILLTPFFGFLPPPDPLPPGSFLLRLSIAHRTSIWLTHLRSASKNSPAADSKPVNQAIHYIGPTFALRPPNEATITDSLNLLVKVYTQRHRLSPLTSPLLEGANAIQSTQPSPPVWQRVPPQNRGRGRRPPSPVLTITAQQRHAHGFVNWVKPQAETVWLG